MTEDDKDTPGREGPETTVVNFSEERLIRLMPDHPLGLDEPDEAYVMACLRKIDEAFALDAWNRAMPDVPIAHIPGRALMRRLMALRKTLNPRTQDQRAAHGMLWGAIGLLNTARALAHDRFAPRAGGHRDR